jgi:hypothetical protein
VESMFSSSSLYYIYTDKVGFRKKGKTLYESSNGGGGGGSDYGSDGTDSVTNSDYSNGGTGSVISTDYGSGGIDFVTSSDYGSGGTDSVTGSDYFSYLITGNHSSHASWASRASRNHANYAVIMLLYADRTYDAIARTVMMLMSRVAGFCL